METRLVKINNMEDCKKDMEEAGELIKAGELVAFPTETVYGLGGNGLLPDAAKKIYAAKGRPSDNPLILHVCDMQMVESLVKEIPDNARRAMEHFWPGPMTVILQKADQVPDCVTGGLDTVAIRMPNHPVALEPMILDGGAVMVGVESTIIDFTEIVPVILRPGWITKESMEEFLGCEVLMNTSLKASDHGIPRAPGMKYKHYAPKAEMVLVLGDDQEKVVDHINQLAKEQKEQGKKIGIIASDETKDLYQADEVISVGQRAHLETVTAHLYDVLREFDHKDVDMIYSEGFEGEPLSEAIMNRMVKAAGHEILRI